jgi:hypothetical protein
MINTEDRPAAEVLMESVALVDGAKLVAIILEKEDSINVKTNCSYKELKWLLDQATHATMCELFGHGGESST